MANGPWGADGQPVPLRATVKMRLGTSNCQFGFHLRDPLNNGTALTPIAEGIATTLLPTLKLILANIDEVTSIVLTNVVTKEGVEVPQTGQTGQAGQAGATLPTFMAATIVMKSSVRARYGQGRFFLPIRGTIHMTDNVLSGGGVTAVNNFVSAFRTAYVLPVQNTAPLAINYHAALAADRPHKSPAPLPAVPATYYDVTSVRVNPILTAIHS
jgi:hypothetical protein